MINTSTLLYILIPAYSFNPKAAFEPFWKTGLEKRPEDRDRIRTRGYTLPNLLIFITPLNINNLLGLLLYKVSLKRLYIIFAYKLKVKIFSVLFYPF